LNKEIPKDENDGSCGHFDFALGDYNNPIIGIEFKWLYGWDKNAITFDFLKCLDNKLPFSSRVSYNVIIRKNNLSGPGNKTNLENAMENAFKIAKERLDIRNAFLNMNEKDVYLIITEIGKNGKRHWFYEKKQDEFIEANHPLRLIN
jgi:hypothetical protein